MSSRRVGFSLSFLCTLAFTAIAAQGASAGQTAFTCIPGAPVDLFATAHCVPGESGSNFGLVGITEETHLKWSNEKTNSTTTGPTNTVLKETIAATNLELESTGAIEGLGGTLKNEEPFGVMKAKVTAPNGIIHNGVIVKSPTGKGCKEFEDNGGIKGTEGVIKSKALIGETVTNGEVDEMVIEPATPPVLETFFIECEPGKVPAELEGTWEVRGSLNCPLHGATIICSHAEVTTQNKLKGKGAKAGLGIKLTLTAGKLPITEPTSPIALAHTNP